MINCGYSFNSLSIYLTGSIVICMEWLNFGRTCSQAENRNHQPKDHYIYHPIFISDNYCWDCARLSIPLRTGGNANFDTADLFRGIRNQRNKKLLGLQSRPFKIKKMVHHINLPLSNISYSPYLYDRNPNQEECPFSKLILEKLLQVK